MQRFTPNQVEHFIEFLLSPIISVDLPFGQRYYKLSTGEKVLVPNMIRNMIHSRIITQYQHYCNSEFSNGFIPLSETVLYAILQRCPAAVRKSLSGLDNISADGSAAFDEMISLCDLLLSFGNSVMFCKNCFLINVFNSGAPSDEMILIKKHLRQSRNYLKLAYKMHVSTNSRVADHCAVFGLSDPKTDQWREQCDHDHDEQ